MSPSPQSIASKLGSLKSRHLSRAMYLRELIKLADLDGQAEAAGEADRVVELRGRIAILEQRVRELESRK